MATLLNTPQEILSILASTPDQPYFINELIRLTGRYPNSVQQALNRLYAKNFITKLKQGNKVFYQISHKTSFTIKTIFSTPEQHTWIKLLNRPTTYAFNYIVCKSNRDRLPEMYGIPVPSFWLNGQTFGVYYLKNELGQLGQVISEKLDRETDFAIKDIR